MTKILIKITLFITILASLLISSCAEYTPNTNDIPEDLIQKDEFTDIMFDVRLTEVIIRQDITQNIGKHADSITKKYYTFLFDKHGINKEQFQRSLNYYTNIPFELDEINNTISDSLTKLKAKIKSTK